MINKKISLNLVGLDGNAISLLGAFRRQAKIETQEKLFVIYRQILKISKEFDKMGAFDISRHTKRLTKEFDGLNLKFGNKKYLNLQNCILDMFKILAAIEPSEIKIIVEPRHYIILKDYLLEFWQMIERKECKNG